jgi:beta-galactosidase GanA
VTDQTPERKIVDAMSDHLAEYFFEAMRKDLRAQLIAFATWLLEGEYGEGTVKIENTVDRYLKEKDD